MAQDWPFDDPENLAVITTTQVMNDNMPIHMVIRYRHDESWVFLANAENEDIENAMLTTLGEVLARDTTLAEIADLPPGWIATRDTIGGAWARGENHDEAPEENLPVFDVQDLPQKV
jgi:hypothetical protein